MPRPPPRPEVHRPRPKVPFGIRGRHRIRGIGLAALPAGRRFGRITSTTSTPQAHPGTFTFPATPGTYPYLCPVPGHAQKGMTGTFTVSAS
jgi:plastocyanin